MRSAANDALTPLEDTRTLLEFRILGPLEAIDGDRVLTPVGAIQRSLLAILLLNVNRVVSSDQLIDLLWDEQPPASGATALQVRVSQLRKALGKAGSVIVTRPPGYLIRLEGGQLDLHRFELLVERAGSALAADDPASAAASLQEALVLWRGPPLADFTYASFAQAAIGRLDELRVSAVEKRIEADLALGRHADLIAELRALVAQHPLRERLRAQLMLALYRSGRQAEALAEYQAGRRVLVNELGIEPGTELQELERAVLRQEPALELADRVPLRSILVAPTADHALDALIALAEPLSSRPQRALVLAQAVGNCEDLAGTSALLQKRRTAMLARGVSSRAAAFTSDAPSRDLVRIAREQDVDLLLIDAPQALLDDAGVRVMLESAPCDVAMLVARADAPAGSSVLVPFGGGEHDWAAIELGAWIAATQERSSDNRRVNRCRWSRCEQTTRECVAGDPGGARHRGRAAARAARLRGNPQSGRRRSARRRRALRPLAAKRSRRGPTRARHAGTGPSATRAPWPATRRSRAAHEPDPVHLVDWCDVALMRHAAGAIGWLVPARGSIVALARERVCRLVLTCPSGASFSVIASRRSSGVAGWASSTWQRIGV